MNVLSLFDGMSCGQIALKELGIIPAVYYASEIDKFAIAQTKLNFPNTIHIGSVVDVNVSDLNPIDLLIGGSPCQSFSFAGKRKGMATKCEIEITRLEQYLQLKADGFEFEGQSYLFWEYMRILTDIRKYNPNVLFILENVEMGKKWERILSEAIGIFGVHINSALVSAQNRERIYWTNIRTKTIGMFGEVYSDIPQPKDRGIILRDVLESVVDEKYFLSDKMVEFMRKNTEKMKEAGNGFKFEPTDGSRKGKSVTTKCGSRMDDDFIVVHNMMPRSSKSGKGGTGHLTRDDGKTYCLDTWNTNAVGFKNKRLNKAIKDNILVDGCLIDSYNNTIHIDKSITVSTRINASSSTHVFINSRIRRLTPLECCRLQTIPSWIIWNCSDTQIYKMCGNGWTIEVIKWIFSFIDFSQNNLQSTKR